MILEHKLVRMFLEIPEYKDVKSRKANKQQKSKCTRRIDYLNSWNGKQSTRFRSSGKQLKNPSGRAAETNYLGRHQMFINVSLLPVCILCQKAFQFRSLDSAAVKCLECFLLSFGLFSFLKKPRVAQAQARRLSMRKQDTHSRSRDCSFPFFQLRLPTSPCGGVAHMLSPLELMLL